MSLPDEHRRVVERTLAEEEKKLGLKNKELQELWIWESAHAASDSRNLSDDIDKLLESSFKGFSDEELAKFCSDVQDGIDTKQETEEKDNVS